MKAGVELILLRQLDSINSQQTNVLLLVIGDEKSAHECKIQTQMQIANAK